MMESGIFHGAAYFSAPDHKITPVQIADGTELVELVTGGRVRFDAGDGDREYGRGSVFWHSAGEYTIYRSVPGDPYRCFVLWFGTGDARKRLGRVSFWRHLDSYEAFCREMLRCAHDEHTDKAVFGDMLYRRLIWELSRPAEADFTGMPEVLRRLLPRIQRHLERDWNIRSLAQEANVSESYLYALFEKHLQVSPHQYLLQRRLHQARMELAGHDRTIKEIAQLCGFLNLESFYRAFRRHCNITPAAYRARYSLEI